jgi:hypothetical protein
LGGTNSIDYGIVLEGEVELELDDGAKTTIGQGGIIIQRGTNHLWRNTTDKVCRIAFVLIEAPAYLHNGKPLDEDRPEHKCPTPILWMSRPYPRHRPGHCRGDDRGRVAEPSEDAAGGPVLRPACRLGMRRHRQRRAGASGRGHPGHVGGHRGVQCRHHRAAGRLCRSGHGRLRPGDGGQLAQPGF